MATKCDTVLLDCITLERIERHHDDLVAGHALVGFQQGRDLGFCRGREQGSLVHDPARQGRECISRCCGSHQQQHQEREAFQHGCYVSNL